MNKESKKGASNFMMAKKVLLALAAFFFLTAASIWTMNSLYYKVLGGPGFLKGHLPATGYFLYDLGAVDQNQDGRLELFTVNHYARQSLLELNNNNYVDLTYTHNLQAIPSFPGLEDMPQLELGDTKPLQIYWNDSKLLIQASTDSANLPLSGKISARTPMTIAHGAPYITIKQLPEESNLEPVSVVSWHLPPGEAISLVVEYLSVPMAISFNTELSLESIGIGRQSISPPSHSIEFRLKDRHGHAWFASTTGEMNVYIANGGLKGDLQRQPQPSIFSDELLLTTANRGYRAVMAQGIQKEDCSAHQVSMIDFDLDGELDLYVACRRKGQSNQLYRGTPSGMQLLHNTGLSIPSEWLGPHAWLPGRSPNGPDLLYAHSKAIWLYSNEGNYTFSPLKLADTEGRIENLAIEDVNNDGVADIFASSPTNSLLLLSDGQNNTYSIYQASNIGLPARSLHAQWVDVNNDGILELYALPGGLFYKNATGTYDQKRAFTPLFDIAPLQARAVWYDANNDGSLDLALALQFKPSFTETAIHRITGRSFFDKMWSTYVYFNQDTANNWLQVDIDDGVGGAGSIGAIITLKRPDTPPMHRIAWGAESSHASQGHYRAYFGLAADDAPLQLSVRWPDGSITEKKVNTVNTRVIIKKPTQIKSSGLQ